MPYIKAERRDKILLDDRLINLEEIKSPGEMNYAIQCLAEALTKAVCIEPNYHVLNEVLGVMEAAKLEYYRRRLVPFEDLKIAENGDVF